MAGLEVTNVQRPLCASKQKTHKLETCETLYLGSFLKPQKAIEWFHACSFVLFQPICSQWFTKSILLSHSFLFTTINLEIYFNFWKIKTKPQVGFGDLEVLKETGPSCLFIPVWRTRGRRWTCDSLSWAHLSILYGWLVPCKMFHIFANVLYILCVGARWPGGESRNL